MEGTCFICNKDISKQESVIVKSRGMETLKTASIKKNDGKYEIIKDLTTIEVHTRCRQKYILKQVDKVEQPDASIASTSLQFSPIKAKLRKPFFNFEKKCLSLPEDYERNENRIKRRIISYIKKPSFTNTVTNILSKRHDDVSKQVCKQIESVTHTVAVDARYHRNSYAQIMVKKDDNDSFKGRPLDENVTKAMDIIYSYIENHDDCQFTLQEFKDLLDDDVPDDKTIESKLIERYGRNIIWCINPGFSPIICFRGIEHEVLTESWYKSRLQNEEEERLRILKAAASIIRQNIRSQVYQINCYPTSDRIFEDVIDVYNFIPAFLDFFTKEIILKDKKGNLDNAEEKCAEISQAIMRAIRPRSFITTL